MGRTIQKASSSAPRPLHASGKSIHPPGAGLKGKTIPMKTPRAPQDAEPRSYSDSSEESAAEAPPSPRTKKVQKRTPKRKSAVSSIKRTKSLVNAHAPLPSSGTATSKRRVMVPVRDTTEVLSDHLQSPLVQAYLTVMVSNMRQAEVEKYGKADPYACVKTNFAALVNRVVRTALLEKYQIIDGADLTVTIPNVTMALIKRVATARLSHQIEGVHTICQASNRKRITPQYIMAYNRIARRLDAAVEELPMSTSGSPIDLTLANEAASAAENLLKGKAASASAPKKARAPRKKLTPELRKAAEEKRAALAAERKRRREEAAAKKKELVEAKKKLRAEEMAEKKRKREEAAAERKRKQEATAEKKAEAAIEKKKRKLEVVAEKEAEAAVEKKHKRKVQKQEAADLLETGAHGPPLSPSEIEDLFGPPHIKKRARVEEIKKSDAAPPSPAKKAKKNVPSAPASPAKVEKRVEEVSPVLAAKDGGGGVSSILDSLLGGGDDNDFDYDF